MLAFKVLRELWYDYRFVVTGKLTNEPLTRKDIIPMILLGLLDAVFLLLIATIVGLFVGMLHV